MNFMGSKVWDGCETILITGSLEGNIYVTDYKRNLVINEIKNAHEGSSDSVLRRSHA